MCVCGGGGGIIAPTLFVSVLELSYQGLEVLKPAQVVGTCLSVQVTLATERHQDTSEWVMVATFARGLALAHVCTARACSVGQHDYYYENNTKHS